MAYKRGARQDMLSGDRSLPPPADRLPDLNARRSNLRKEHDRPMATSQTKHMLRTAKHS